MNMLNEVQWIGLRGIIEEVIDEHAQINCEYGEDLYVKNTDYVATRVLEKMLELGIIELENK